MKIFFNRLFSCILGLVIEGAIVYRQFVESDTFIFTVLNSLFFYILFFVVIIYIVFELEKKVSLLRKFLTFLKSIYGIIIISVSIIVLLVFNFQNFLFDELVLYGSLIITFLASVIISMFLLGSH